MPGKRWGGDRSGRPRRGRWSQAELARLRDLYGHKTLDQISRELNRPAASVQRMAESLFPGGDKVGDWDEEEAQRLKQYLGVCDADIIARIFGRVPSDVREHIRSLDENQTVRPWTQEDVADLKRLHGTRTDRDIARVFQRPEASVTAMAAELCLAKDKAFVRRRATEATPPVRMPRWSAEEVVVLKEIYALSSNLEIAQRLDRSVKSVVSKAHGLGLRKDHSRLVEMGVKNVSLRHDRNHEAGPQAMSPEPGSLPREGEMS
jgi:hypothetical protein